MKTDVSIVGGGPAGCFLGKLLAENGVDVTVVEEHPQIGSPSCCAGVVGEAGFKELGIRPKDWVVERLNRTRIFPPEGAAVEIGRGKSEAIVLNRAEFDRWLGREAAKAGTKILLKTKCVDAKFGDSPKLKLSGNSGGTLESRIVVGADGPVSIVAQKAGLLKREKFIRCAQVELRGDFERGVAEVYLGRDLFPGFFGWAFRAGDLSRVGLGAMDGHPVDLLKSFVERQIQSEIIGPNQVLDFCAGLIPQAFPRKVYSDRVLLVGDAAGQVKPLTGGGIYYGLSCAKIAAEVIAEALEKSPYKKILNNYESGVKKKFGLDVELAIRAKRVFDGMSDEDLNLMVGLIGTEDVRDIIKKNFEFDSHGKLIQAMLPKIPNILRKTGTKRLFKYAKAFLK